VAAPVSLPMPILHHPELIIDADAVLRGQGADPKIIRVRRPQLVTVAEDALVEGLPLIEPEVAYMRIKVERIDADKVHLEGGDILSGAAVARGLQHAEHVIVATCTIGTALEELASEVVKEDMVRGLALDGVGSAAVEALANWACRQFEAEAAAAGLQTTVPQNPGMIGWPIEIGQPEIFAVLDVPGMRVTLTDYHIMMPRKSLSLVVGVGSAVRTEGIVCDNCGVKDSCKYRIPAG
jgi:hypothetical protein